MRFDGTVGFPWITVEKGETPEMAINRTICEQLGCSVDKFTVTSADHLYSKISHNLKRGKRHCIHSYAKEISLEMVQQLEKSSLLRNDYGIKVTVILENISCRLLHTIIFQILGVMRCPLYTLPNGLGLPAFLKYYFTSDSKDQLLCAIRERNLLSHTELQAAIDNCNHIKTLVTVQDADV